MGLDGYELGEGARLAAAGPDRTAEYAALVRRNRAHLDSWESWSAELSGLEAARAMLADGARAAGAGTLVPVFVVVGDRLAGYASLAADPALRTGTLGYWLDGDAQGRGLMTRTVTALAADGFQRLGLVRVSVTTAVGNARSAAVARRAGFTLEGVLRHAGQLRGAPVDVQVWGLLPGEEPEPVRRRAPRR